MDLNQSLAVSPRQIIDNMMQGIIISDRENIIQAVNPAFCSLMGFAPEELIGKNLQNFLSESQPPEFVQTIWKAINESGSWRGDVINRKKDGEPLTHFLNITTIKDENNQVMHFLCVYSNSPANKLAEEALKQLAFYDPLTELPNRTLFHDRLKQAISQAERNSQMLAVLFLDLDRVKVINDSLGIPVGDMVLKGVAKRLKECMREGDTIARMGGDEFMMVLPGVKGIEDISRITEKILESMKPCFQLDGHDLYVTASIGISIFPIDTEDPETLLKNADTALNQAKILGRDNFQLFTPSMKDEILEQLAMEQDLRRALDKEEFVIHYQPLINILSGEIVGVEALLRWQHKTLGLIPPKGFIKGAEETGLIIPIGEWVLRKACEQTKKWMDSDLPKLKISVNLSARQFEQKDLIKMIEKILADTNLPPNMLELEITESAVMQHLGVAFAIPHALKAMGLRLAIDDFGTGYSSLNYLRRIPVNTLKMDQSFMQDLGENSNEGAIVSAVIALGHGLDLSVTAEGVETEEQLKFLKAHKCDGMQGFLFSEAVTADNFENLLRNRKTLQEGLLFSNI